MKNAITGFTLATLAFPTFSYAGDLGVDSTSLHEAQPTLLSDSEMDQIRGGTSLLLVDPSNGAIEVAAISLGETDAPALAFLRQPLNADAVEEVTVGLYRITVSNLGDSSID